MTSGAPKEGTWGKHGSSRSPRGSERRPRYGSAAPCMGSPGVVVVFTCIARRSGNILLHRHHRTANRTFDRCHRIVDVVFLLFSNFRYSSTIFIAAHPPHVRRPSASGSTPRYLSLKSEQWPSRQGLFSICCLWCVPMGAMF